MSQSKSEQIKNMYLDCSDEDIKIIMDNNPSFHVTNNGDIKSIGEQFNDAYDKAIESATGINQIKKSKYTKTYKGIDFDVYNVLQLWNVTNPALQHLIKKALQAGNRGHKNLLTDLQDIIDSAIRAKELEYER